MLAVVVVLTTEDHQPELMPGGNLCKELQP